MIEILLLTHPYLKGTKDNSENSTYLGSDFEDDEHHTVKRKEFYQVRFNMINWPSSVIGTG